jgi:hypothetical protein
VAAYQDVAEAFDAYDDALLEAYGEVTPLEIYGGDEDDEDEDDDELEGPDDEDDDGVYLGLDDSEYDADDGDDAGSEGSPNRVESNGARRL